ncbi:hypothetical protein [Jatrophihabitans sp.]|jgi:hypothetical protein|uniref:hypothetical protein n=1 Tax=Jatrophihabitans sp. TaxID=1932789 RepID=UPI002EFFAD07
MTEEPRQPGAGNVPPEATSQPPGYGEPATQPGYAQPGYAQPGYDQPGYPQPGYPQPGFGQQPPVNDPGYGPPGYGQPLPGESGVGLSGLGEPGIGQPGMGQPALGQPGFGQPVGGQPVGGRSGPGPAGLQDFDPKSVDPLDWGIIAAGVVAFIFSTFNYFTYKVEIPPFSRTVSVSAWHGVLAPIATLLAIFAAVLLAAELIAKMRLAFPVRLVVLGAFALASLLLLLALFVIPGNTGGFDVLGVKIDKGHGIGYWISLLAVLAGTGLAFKRFTDTGGTLPTRG